METSTVTAEEIMTRRLALTTPDTHVMDAIERLIAQQVSGLPVVDTDGKFAGRFSERCAIAALDLTAASQSEGLARVRAADIMQQNGLQLSSEQDVFESAAQLVQHHVSGAPVVDADGTLRGVFSENSAMHVFIGLCWEQLPSAKVTAWLDRHDERRITEDTRLDDILDRFQTTSYRRLIVLQGPKLVGQLTRQDALRAALAHAREPLHASRHLSGGDQLGARTTVESWMQTETVGVERDADVLKIATLFIRSGARQIPVVKDGHLEGQISRSDLLRAIQRFFPQNSSSESGAQPLYLSSTNKRDAVSVVN